MDFIQLTISSDVIEWAYQEEGNTMKKSIAEIEAELAAAKEAATAEIKAEMNALWEARTYTWEMHWGTRRWGGSGKSSNYVFYCGKRLSDETLAAIAAFDAKYPNRNNYDGTYVSRPYDWGKDKVEGMEYILIGNLLTHTGGGTLVLKGNEEDPDTFSHEPRELTDIEVQSLKNCIVPDSLKR